MSMVKLIYSVDYTELPTASSIVFRAVHVSEAYGLNRGGDYVDVEEEGV